MGDTKLNFFPYFSRSYPFGPEFVNGRKSFTFTLNIGKPLPEPPAPPIAKTAVLRGPGDVSGIERSVIARIEPKPGTNTCPPNNLAFIEFVDPDFPWRYSPDPAPTAEGLEPWLCLIVLSAAEIGEMANAKIEVVKAAGAEGKEILSVRNKYLPDLSRCRMSAHVQFVNVEGLTIDGQGLNPKQIDFIKANPASCCARLVCFRKLEPSTAYTAFLVSVYKDSLEAFLTGKSPAAPSTVKAWATADPQAVEDCVRLPIFFSWPFMTSEPGDFEDLARKLTPFRMEKGSAGVRAVDASLLKKSDGDSGPGGQEDPFFMREGALVAPGFLAGGTAGPLDEVREPYTAARSRLPENYEAATLAVLNESLAPSGTDEDGEDPLLTIPAYGRFFRKTRQVAPPAPGGAWAGGCPWISELNLDPRNRTVASFGTLAIQRNQDQFMHESWLQVGDIRKANERLRTTQAGARMGGLLRGKHLDGLSDEMFALVTSPFHAHIVAKDGSGAETSLKCAFARSGIPRGVANPHFRRFAYGRIPKQRLAVFKPWTDAEETAKRCRIFGCPCLPEFIAFLIKVCRKLLSRFASNRIAVVLLALVIRILLALSAWLKCQAPKAPGMTDFEKRQIKVLADKFKIALPSEALNESFLAPVKAEVIPVLPIPLGTPFRALFDHRKVLHAKTAGLIRFNDGRRIGEEFEPIMAYPKIETPLYKSLCEISPDYLLPGIDRMEGNGVTLLEENRRFKASYMAGVNGEMNDEYAWSGFPTDKRGTPFKNFWEQVMPDAHDIAEIHRWRKDLGENPSDPEEPADPCLVLVIKGDIIRRYPSIIVYAVKIKKGAGSNDHDFKYKFWRQYVDDAAMTSCDLPVQDYDTMLPAFRANLGPDILAVGFHLTKRNIKGDQRDGEYYFILQESFDLPQFGLDTVGNGTDPSWDKLGSSMKNGYVDSFAPLFSGNPSSSADVGKTLFQRPFKLAIHQSRFLKEDD